MGLLRAEVEARTHGYIRYKGTASTTRLVPSIEIFWVAFEYRPNPMVG